MLASTLALAAAAFGVVQSLTLLGQARTLRRLGTAREVSLPFLLLAVLSSTTWLGYGLLHRDVALLLVNAVGLAGAAVTLTTAVRLRAAEAADAMAAADAMTANDAVTAIDPTDASAGVAARGSLPGSASFETSVPELATAAAA